MSRRSCNGFDRACRDCFGDEPAAGVGAAQDIRVGSAGSTGVGGGGGGGGARSITGAAAPKAELENLGTVAFKQVGVGQAGRQPIPAITDCNSAFARSILFIRLRLLLLFLLHLVLLAICGL